MKTIDEVLEFVYQHLPKSFDITPSGEVVSRADIGEEGYIENTEFLLYALIEQPDMIDFVYWGENDVRHYVLEVVKCDGIYKINDIEKLNFYEINQSNLTKYFEKAFLSIN